MTAPDTESLLQESHLALSKAARLVNDMLTLHRMKRSEIVDALRQVENAGVALAAVAEKVGISKNV